MLLAFEALCADFAPASYSLEEFASCYTTRKLQSEAYSIPWGGRQKLIVNLPDSNHGWNNSVECVYGPWEAAKESNRGSVPRIWDSSVVAQGNGGAR